MSDEDLAREQALRERAKRQVRKRRDSHLHLLVYVLVNGFVVGIWAITDINAFFWPVFRASASSSTPTTCTGAGKSVKRTSSGR